MLQHVYLDEILSDDEQMIPTLYDANTIDTLEWPETEECFQGREWLEAFVKNGLQHYIENIQAEIFLLKIDKFVFPVILPLENCMSNPYVCSPYQHYITLGKQNVHLIPNPMAVAMVKPLMSIVEQIGKLGKLDSVVYVNNWLFSVDLYPEGLTEVHFQAIVNLLKERFPVRAIVFRSLNRVTNNETMISLEKVGFQHVASRMVYISDVKNDEIFQTRIFKSDLRILKNTPYVLVDQQNLCIEDCDEFLRLQNLLYVHQHSSFQPVFKKEYLELLFNQNLLHFKSLKLDGVTKGVIGYFHRDNVMYCPYIGFDKTDGDQSTIYRLLNTFLLLEARENVHFFNQGAGASFYKSVRRAQGVIECMAVYTQHLPVMQKVAWSTVRCLMNKLGVSYMKKF